MSTPESKTLKACIGLLKLRGIEPIRHNTGAMHIDGRFLRFGQKGSSDLIAIVPRSGRFLAVEVKAPGGRPTDDQIAFIDHVRRMGAVALVVEDVKQLSEALDRLEKDPWVL